MNLQHPGKGSMTAPPLSPSFETASLPLIVLISFYRGTMESLLTICITVWNESCKASEFSTLQKVMRLAKNIKGTSLPSIQGNFDKHCICKATGTLSYPSRGLFNTLLSGRRFWSIQTNSSRLGNSLFKHAITLQPPVRNSTEPLN